MRYLVAVLSLVAALSAAAQALIPPTEAFNAWVTTRNGTSALRLALAPGHAIYRDRLSVTTMDGRSVVAALPAGVVHEDPNLGRQRLLLDATSVPLVSLPVGAQLTVRMLGCKIDEYCYPPMTLVVTR